MPVTVIIISEGNTCHTGTEPKQGLGHRIFAAVCRRPGRYGVPQALLALPRPMSQWQRRSFDRAVMPVTEWYLSGTIHDSSRGPGDPRSNPCALACSAGSLARDYPIDVPAATSPGLRSPMLNFATSTRANGQNEDAACDSLFSPCSFDRAFTTRGLSRWQQLS